MRLDLQGYVAEVGVLVEVQAGSWESLDVIRILVGTLLDSSFRFFELRK